MNDPKHSQNATLPAWQALADAGAQSAASAMADLTKRAVEVGAPKPVPGAVAPGMKVAAGIFFELLGGVRGELAVLLSEEICQELVSILLGGPMPLRSEDAISALAEIGNVLASHAASGVAERLGESVLPTPPDLDLDAPHAYLERRRAASDWAVRLETTLRDETGASVCVLVWAVPEAPPTAT